ncbi:PREDICTED: uncharacterized protein LOC101304290 [Fragaria vesca subsp. vesca]
MTMTMNNPPPKKKKGRPSLLDLQKRFLQQQQNPHFLNPTSAASARVPATRRANPNPSDDDDDERAKKKHKLLLGINHNNSRKPTLQPFNSAAAGSDSNADDDDPDKISAARRRSNLTKIDPLMEAGSLASGWFNPQPLCFRSQEQMISQDLPHSPHEAFLPEPYEKNVIFIIFLTIKFNFQNYG